MMNKNLYETPVAEIIKISSADILMLSEGGEGGEEITNWEDWT